MFCSKCGHQLDDDAKFCSVCGQSVEGAGRSVGADFSKQHEEKKESYQQVYNAAPKTDWKKYFTLENVERFAPLAALLPFVLKVLSIVFGILGMLPVVGMTFRLVSNIVKIVIFLITAGATAGLVCVAVKKKDMTSVFTWIAPAATLLAALSCLFGGLLGTVCGLAAIVLGIELAARIVIRKEPMDAPFNMASAINTYKEWYAANKGKYKEMQKQEQTILTVRETSQFDGSGVELLGYIILGVLVSAITCGIATPWMICKIYKWQISHTTINGRRLTFTGTGASLLGHWILWEILSVITCGIYTFFAHVALRKWEVSHTYIEGEPITANGNESCFDGGSLAYFGYGLLSAVLLLFTLGLAYPWVMAMLQRWDTRHQVINHRRLVFSGSGLGFLGEYIIIFILTLITCGIYSPWGTVRMNKYIIRHTDFE